MSQSAAEATWCYILRECQTIIPDSSDKEAGVIIILNNFNVILVLTSSRLTSHARWTRLTSRSSHTRGDPSSGRSGCAVTISKSLRASIGQVSERALHGKKYLRRLKPTSVIVSAAGFHPSVASVCLKRTDFSQNTMLMIGRESRSRRVLDRRLLEKSHRLSYSTFGVFDQPTCSTSSVKI